MSGNPLNDIVFSGSRDVRMTGLTMSSLEIAELVEKRHDNVKRTIDTLAETGVIVRPQIEDEPDTDAMGRIRITKVYVFSGERGKRDSIVVVAQLSPEFTARLVDRWQYLEQQVSAHQPKAISRGVTVTGLDAEALGQVGGVFRNVVRKRDAELLEEINRSFQARVFGYIETSLPLIDDYVTGLVDDALDRYVSRQPGLDPIVRAVEQRLAERVAQDEGPVVLAPMATYRGQRCQAVELPALPRTDLRTWRIAKGWTLRQVAEKIGTSPSRVCKHEWGHCIPSPQFIMRYRKMSGGKLTADVFTEAYQRRKMQEGRWPQAPSRSRAKLKSLND